MVLSVYDTPTVVNINVTSSGILATSVSTIYYDTTSGTEDISVDLPILPLISTKEDTDVEVEINDTSTETYKVDDEVIIRNSSSNIYASKILIDVWQLYTNSGLLDIPFDLFLYDVLQLNEVDVVTSLRINIGTVPTKRDVLNELELSDPKYFDIDTSVYCVSSGTLFNILNDIQQQNGRIVGLNTDIYTASGTNEFIEVDNYCVDEYTKYIGADVTTHSGSLSGLGATVYSTISGVSGSIQGDIKTRSMFVNGFFLSVDEFTTASSTGYVEVIDYLYPIVEENTYMLKDGATISGAYFEDIPYGKRLYFNPQDDFYSPGEIVLSFHAESSIGEVLEEDFYLLYGYDLKLNEVITWKPNRRIVIRGEADNLAFCPNNEGTVYYFDTRDYDSLNLPVSIRAVTSVDLPVEIYPQSTTFFYGETYTVKIKGVKDFAGNLMEDFEYTFTIENPNS